MTSHFADLVNVVPITTTNGDEAAESTWHPVDLADALDGITEPGPVYLSRTDGKKLIYAGKVHWFQGESESLKSWAAQLATKEAIALGIDVLYIDFEDRAAGVISRLLALGATREQIERHLVYINPDEPLNDRHGTATSGNVELGTVLASRHFLLAVIDGVTEAMTTEQLDLLDNTDIARWMARLPRRLSRLGIAVICIDHVTKSKEGRGRYAIGGQHKLSGVDGATYEFSIVRRLSRSTHDPVEASATILIHKDRPGWVRAIARRDGEADRVGTLEIVAYPDGAIEAHITDSEHVATPPRELIDKVVQYLRSYDGASQTRIEENVEGKARTIRAALGWLHDNGWIDIVKSGVSHRHQLTTKGWNGGVE